MSQHPQIKCREAVVSSIKLLLERFEKAQCDSDAVSDCARCNAVFLAKNVREMLDGTSVPEALRSEEDGAHLYCTTCGSCGEGGCCPPEKCQKARRSEILEEAADLCDQNLDQFSGTECTYRCDVAQAIRALKTIPSPRGK